MEDSYFFQWQNFKRKNKDKTELDFIEEILTRYADEEQECKERMKLNKLSDSKLLEHIEDINYRKYNNEEVKKYFSEADILEDFREKNSRMKNVSIFPKSYLEMILRRIKPDNARDIARKESLLSNDEFQLKWTGTKVELIELVKALIENDSVNGKQKDIISAFTNFFNVEINYPDKTIQDIKNRNNGSETLFIDSLKSSLLSFIKRENEP